MAQVNLTVADRLPAPARSVPTRERAPRRLAEQVALAIEQEVLDAGWPAGASLGSESELLERFSVSRAVLREAARLTEFLGIATMRRGPGGGLMVITPDPSAIMSTVLVYLTFRGVRFEQVMEARRPIEALGARLAARRRTPADVNALWSRLATEMGEPSDDLWVMHDLLASISGNPAVELFSETITRVIGQYHMTDRWPAEERVHHRQQGAVAHRAIVEAIANGDEDLAAARSHSHLRAVEHVLVQGRSTRALALSFGPAGEERELRSMHVARQIFADVVDMGWPVGSLFGSEPELQARYQVSRAVLRESLRLLEFHHVLQTRRGHGGGVMVDAPDENATTEAMAVYLRSQAITVRQLLEVREALELAIVDTAVETFGQEEIDQLWLALEDEKHSPVEAVDRTPHRLHQRIAELTGNHVLLLFVHALTRLTEQHQVSPEQGLPMSNEEAAASVARAHRAIVKAIAARDAPSARRKMQLHLGALPDLLR